MSDLPAGWAGTDLGSTTSKIGSGATPKGGHEAYFDAGVPLIRSMNVHFDGVRLKGLVHLDEGQAKALANVEVRQGDVLLNITGASIGRVAVAPPELAGARVNQHVAIIRTMEGVEPHYVRAYLASPDIQALIGGENYGVTRPALTKGLIEKMGLPLAPVPEQRRIIAKLDSLTARTARARADLDRIPALTARYKQAVLTKAFSGELTARWRDEHGEVGLAADEVDMFQRRRAAYESGRRGSRLRDVPPLRLPSQCLDLPATWASGCVADVADLRVGYAFKSTWFTAAGVPLIRGANVGVGRLDLEDLKRLSPERAEEFADYRLVEGDILLAMDRPVISAGLKAARVTIREAGALLVQRVASPVLTPLVDANFLWWLFHSQLYLGQIERHATGSDLPHVSGNDILTTSVPLPPLSEQREIARRITGAFTEIDRLAAEAAAARRLLGRLDQAVLAKAFRGELVPQDPADERASVLLDRIRAERAAAPKLRRGRKVA